MLVNCLNIVCPVAILEVSCSKLYWHKTCRLALTAVCCAVVVYDCCFVVISLVYKAGLHGGGRHTYAPYQQ